MLLQFHNKGVVEAGCDEAGRGCLAGPVFAAAVILPADVEIEDLNDSKKITPKNREKLRLLIEEQALSFAVANVSPAEIDEINILNASYRAMHKALEMLDLVPGAILVDGNRFLPYKNLPHHCIVKGDGKYMSIAAASILAKTYRDEYMIKMDKEFPAYEWKKNKGYPTKKHRQAIRDSGITPLHRKSFRLLDQQLQLNL